TYPNRDPGTRTTGQNRRFLRSRHHAARARNIRLAFRPGTLPKAKLHPGRGEFGFARRSRRACRSSGKTGQPRNREIGRNTPGNLLRARLAGECLARRQASARQDGLAEDRFELRLLLAARLASKRYPEVGSSPVAARQGAGNPQPESRVRSPPERPC